MAERHSETIPSNSATTALNFGLPFVSNNKKHFVRVPGLDLRGY